MVEGSTSGAYPINVCTHRNLLLERCSYSLWAAVTSRIIWFRGRKVNVRRIWSALAFSVLRFLARTFWYASALKEIHHNSNIGGSQVCGEGCERSVPSTLGCIYGFYPSKASCTTFSTRSGCTISRLHLGQSSRLSHECG